MNLGELRTVLATRAEAEGRAGALMFMGRPDRWWETHHWRCPNDHVSIRVLLSEERGDLCLACREPVVLTFPEDRDGPLDESFTRPVQPGVKHRPGD